MSGGTMDARAATFDANKIRALIAKYLGIDFEQVTDETHFRNDFDLDSLDQLELLILIEEEFAGVEFSGAAVEQIEVVGDLIRYIEINCLLGNLYAQTFRRSSSLIRKQIEGIRYPPRLVARPIAGTL
jgi:acyl carrier protein